MKNDSFETIGEALKTAEKILLFPHINIDGDAAGSSFALAHTLREMGKECFVLMEDSIPENLRFMDKGYTSRDLSVIEDPDVCMCVDCGETGRFPKRAEVFAKGKVKICVDHHRTSDPFCDYNYIDPGAAATGELVYELIKAMGAGPDKEAGEALFAAIITDTGGFRYSNTTARTHRIVGELYDAGIDSYSVNTEIYENVRPEKIRIFAKAMETLNFYCEGKVGICRITGDMLKETGATLDETDGIVAEIRNIRGVEIGVTLKEHADGKVKVSLRSKHEGDVAAIATQFGGGGHTKAAGCTMECSMDEAEEKIAELAGAQLG